MPSTTARSAEVNAQRSSERLFDFVEDFWDEVEFEQICGRVRSIDETVVEEFTQNFLKYLGSSARTIFLNSGSEAIRCAVSMVKSERRRGVLMPAFCCRVVAAAILEAGCRPILLDAGSEVGSIDWQSCEKALTRRDVAAVLVPHLFGAPLDFRRILKTAAEHGVAVIEDCAQCLGGQIGNRAVGTIGDASIFSFGFDKPISLCGGGLLVVNNESLFPPKHLETLSRGRELPDAAVEIEELRRIRQFVLSRRVTTDDLQAIDTNGDKLESVCREHPYIGAVLARVVKSRVSAPLPARAVGMVRAALGVRLLKQYDSVKTARNQHHELLSRQIRVGELQRAGGDVAPAWLRGKFVAPGVPVAHLDRAARLLRARGYAAGRSNWSRTLDREPRFKWRAEQIGRLSRAHDFCRSSIDVPIHQNLSTADVQAIAECMNEALA